MQDLEKSLHVASSLAQCDSFIKHFWNLTRDQIVWALNLFIIDPPTYQKDSGKVATILFRLDRDLYKDIFDLSLKIKCNKELNCVDWDFILCGIELYRRKLIMQSSSPLNCGEIW